MSQWPIFEIDRRVFLAQNFDAANLGDHDRCFKPTPAVQSPPHCDEYGPVNLSCIVHFIKSLERELATHPDCKIVFCVEKGRKNLTDAVFLLGAYMVLKEQMRPKEVAASFWRIKTEQLESFRDATHSKTSFELSLLDCWYGLQMGLRQNWVRYSKSPALWGRTNIAYYRQFDGPTSGDLHLVVPGKIVAFRGPQDLGGRGYLDTRGGLRVFSPAFYADVLAELGVSTIIRLNEPLYDARAFTAHGFQHHDLVFDESACPPGAVVAAFLAAVDAAPGAVAVHCSDGRGRTGTLVALYLMRSHGFTARAAMGWLRIMRPGSVAGEQQEYLCAVEGNLRSARSSHDPIALSSSSSSSHGE